jgi:hypothetical protein
MSHVKPLIDEFTIPELESALKRRRAEKIMDMHGQIEFDKLEEKVIKPLVNGSGHRVFGVYMDPMGRITFRTNVGFGDLEALGYTVETTSERWRELVQIKF